MIMMTVSSVVADKDNINNIHEKMILRNSFYKKNRSNPQTIHEIVISIQQNNIQQLQNTLLEISTPGNAKYQQWLNSNEVGELVRNEVATNNVKQWIHRIGAEIISESLHGEYLRVTAPISIWERELQTEFYEWEDHQKRNKHKEGWNVEYDSINKQFSTYHRSEDYTIPTDLREHITAIFKTCQAPPVITHHSQMKRDNSDSSESTQKSKDLSSKHDIHPFKSTMYVRQQTTQDKSNGSTDTDTDADSSFIHLFNHFLPKNQPKKSPIHTQSAPTDVTVPFLNSFYKVASNVGSPLINQSVFETDNQYYSTQDLASFQSTYGIPSEIPIAINGNSIKSCPQVSQCAEGIYL